MKKALFLTPVVTAFDAEGNLDIPANKRVYEYLIRGGVDGLVVMGSTGEFFAMTTRQKQELIDLAVETVGHRAQLLIGTSCMTVEDTVELAVSADYPICTRSCSHNGEMPSMTGIWRRWQCCRRRWINCLNCIP